VRWSDSLCGALTEARGPRPARSRSLADDTDEDQEALEDGWIYGGLTANIIMLKQHVTDTRGDTVSCLHRCEHARWLTLHVRGAQSRRRRWTRTREYIGMHKLRCACQFCKTLRKTYEEKFIQLQARVAVACPQCRWR
jgi:hypothetical protein